MLLRKSFYGQFWGCSGFPKCKTIENIASSGMEKKPVDKAGDTSVDPAPNVANVASKVPVSDYPKAPVNDIKKVSKNAAGKKSRSVKK